MKLTREQITRFQKIIFDWWNKNKRDLPWRHTHDPYKIMVSEVMLQQTQVSRVLARYTEFIERYPTVNDLAQAAPADVLRLWKGMGYNRRALYLHTSAKAVVEDHHGKFPDNEKELSKLPGLGIYTARAILVFAYKQNVACVDTNIRQIITHFFFDDKPQKPSVIQSVADQLVPVGKSWAWHQALMDYGSVHNSLFTIPNSKRNKQKIPFKETDRFLRGRVIDLLRTSDINELKLIKNVAVRYNKEKERIKQIVEGLIKDGLVERSGTTLTFPRQ